MRQQIKSISIVQTAKFVGALYFVVGVLFALFVLIVGFRVRHGGAAMPPGMPHRMHPPLLLLVIAPILYGIAGFIGSMVMSWIYNQIAKRIGGIEFELSAPEN
jgi:hypothetical protein